MERRAGQSGCGGWWAATGGVNSDPKHGSTTGSATASSESGMSPGRGECPRLSGAHSGASQPLRSRLGTRS